METFSVVPIPKSSDKGSPKNNRTAAHTKQTSEHVYGLLSKHLQLAEPVYDSQFAFQ